MNHAGQPLQKPHWKLMEAFRLVLLSIILAPRQVLAPALHSSPTIRGEKYDISFKPPIKMQGKCTGTIWPLFKPKSIEDCVALKAGPMSVS
jgi:hypothetical protein